MIKVGETYRLTKTEYELLNGVYVTARACSDDTEFYVVHRADRHVFVLDGHELLELVVHETRLEEF